MRKLWRAGATVLLLFLLCCPAHAQEETIQTPEELCKTAMEMYAWFALSPLDVDMSIPDSSLCRFRVYDERYDTKAEMESALRGTFSEEITQMLLSSGVYAEEDGYLYTAPPQRREIDPSIAATEYYLAEQTDTTQTYIAAVFYTDGASEEIIDLEEYTLFREKIDDVWVFTEFWFFW